MARHNGTRHALRSEARAQRGKRHDARPYAGLYGVGTPSGYTGAPQRSEAPSGPLSASYGIPSDQAPRA